MMGLNNSKNTEDICPICTKFKSEAVKVIANSNIHSINCKICGKYRIDLQDILSIKGNDYDDKRYILSGITRYNSEKNTLLDFNLEKEEEYLYSSLIPKNPYDSFDKILFYISNKADHAGDFVPIRSGFDYPIAFAKNEDEFKHLLRIMSSDLKWITFTNPSKSTIHEDQTKYQLTAEGWKRLIATADENKLSNQIFVAMKFNDKPLDEAWDKGFKKAIIETGYSPFRVDKQEHNKKICDEIIAGIKSSSCVISDATGINAGVYYEAGFAKGIGLEVIWTCREDCVKNLHFDTRQYNHIVWKDNDDLKTQLIARIRATLSKRTRK